MSSTVILLNQDYTFLNSISWQKAICLMVKGKAEVLKYTDKIIKNFDGSVIMKIPAVMKIIKMVRTLYKTKVPFSKRNVLVRDGYKCAYCGVHSKNLTIDHVVAKSRGGKSTFENTVASCKKCNAKKGNLSCREANMFPKANAYQPTISEFLRMKFSSMGMDDTLRELGVF
jgi:5-methylcytosine-specific restriction endonuclease McrA